MSYNSRSTSLQMPTAAPTPNVIAIRPYSQQNKTGMTMKQVLLSKEVLLGLALSSVSFVLGLLLALITNWVNTR